MSDEHETDREGESSCCPATIEATPPTKRRNLGKWATAGSLFSAVLASACCWLPLVAVVFGASAAGVGAVFEAYRPYFLVAATLLLGAGFYFLYMHKEACEPGTACAVPNVRTQRFSRAMFWVAVLFIGAFAFFPNYAGYLLGRTHSATPGGSVAAAKGQHEIQLELGGMTCEACAAGITTALAKVAGVAGVDVDYATQRARVRVGNAALVADATPLIRAVESTGYRAKVIPALSATGTGPGTGPKPGGDR